MSTEDSSCKVELEKSFDTQPESPISDPPLPEVPSTLEAPEGGPLAWLQVLASFFILVNTWGIVNSFGAFQTYYQMELLSSQSPSAISWIGSTQAFLLLLVGSLTGPIFDRGYLHSLLLTGSSLVVFGLMMTSLATEYYQIFLAQGVTVGLGAGCLFIPSVAVLSTYFVKRRAMAMGITASGSSLGGVLYPIVFRQLQPKIGFAWATRVIGLIALATLFISNVTMRRRITPKTTRSLIDWTALREAPFMLFTAGNFFAFMGIYVPFIFISAYALEKTDADENLAFYLVPILNAASALGRIFPNILADRAGSMNVLIPCAFACAILAYTWMAVRTTGDLLAFGLLYGFFSGSFVSLPPSVIANLSPDVRLVGTRLGMSFCIAGLGVLVGNPVAGAILNIEEGDFVRAQAFGASVTLAGAVFIFFGRLSKVGLQLRVKI